MFASQMRQTKSCKIFFNNLYGKKYLISYPYKEKCHRILKLLSLFLFFVFFLGGGGPGKFTIRLGFQNQVLSREEGKYSCHINNPNKSTKRDIQPICKRVQYTCLELNMSLVQCKYKTQNSGWPQYFHHVHIDDKLMNPGLLRICLYMQSVLAVICCYSS